MPDVGKPQPQQENQWLPPAPPPLVFGGFDKGLNTNASRPGIEDNETLLKG